MEQKCFVTITRLDPFVIQQSQRVGNLSLENQALKSLYFNSLLTEIRVKKEKSEKAYQIQKTLKNKSTQTNLTCPLTITVRHLLTRQKCQDIKKSENSCKKLDVPKRILRQKNIQSNVKSNPPSTISLRRITRQHNQSSNKPKL